MPAANSLRSKSKPLTALSANCMNRLAVSVPSTNRLKLAKEASMTLKIFSIIPWRVHSRLIHGEAQYIRSNNSAGCVSWECNPVKVASRTRTWAAFLYTPAILSSAINLLPSSIGQQKVSIQILYWDLYPVCFTSTWSCNEAINWATRFTWHLGSEFALGFPSPLAQTYHLSLACNRWELMNGCAYVRERDIGDARFIWFDY